MESILNEVKDSDGIAGSTQSGNVDKDNSSSLPNKMIDPSEEVMSQNEILSPDEIKESSRTSESDAEALADDEYLAAELEKVRNMTPEEAAVAKHEAYEKAFVAKWEANYASCKVEKAASHVRAMHESVKKYPRTVLQKMWSPQTPVEALKEAIERCKAAMRELKAAQRTVDKSDRLAKAISRTCEKRPITDCEGPSCSYST